MARSVKFSIALFEQVDGESFHHSWERFMSYVGACPSHRYTIGDLFLIFFECLREEAKDYMMALDGGALVEMTPEEAWERLESMRWDIGIMDGTLGGDWSEDLDHGELDGHLRSMGGDDSAVGPASSHSASADGRPFPVDSQHWVRYTTFPFIWFI